MSQLRLVSTDHHPRLLRLIGFDPEVEGMAFRRLAELDLEGCRADFGRLVDQLDLTRCGKRGRHVALLLLDLLQKVNRRIHRPATDGQAYQANRIRLLETFADCQDAEQAREAFLPALNRLLAPLRGDASAHPLVDRARGYIDQNYNARISLSSVARMLHLSPNYLSRLFRQETGVTLTAYIHRVRLEHAMVLLAEGERSISEIAYLVGYQNYRDFYRNFVKYENASPRQVQRRLSPEQG